MKLAALAALSGVIYFTGFAGFDVWPLAFVAFIPILFALEQHEGLSWKQVAVLGVIFGTVKDLGGFYWLIPMLKTFSGFSLPLCILFATILCAFQGGRLVLFCLLYVRGRRSGYPILPVAVLSLVTAEFVYPTLFDNFLSNSFYDLPPLVQVVDLGGPLLLSGIAMAINVGLFEILSSRVAKRKIAWRDPAIALGLLAATLVYGFVRIPQFDSQSESAPKIRVGMVQANMGLFEKRQDPYEGLRRHIEQSQRLEAENRLDLLVWPESAYTFFIPEEVANVRDRGIGPLKTPVLFGGLAIRGDMESPQHFNTAYITDEHGTIRGTYDKTYLLAFGEYLPFGDLFPQLYEISRNSGRFTPGKHVRPLPFRDYRISTLICYEDILPGFVRSAVKAGNPHLLVNVTNDAWFGDTTEPWIHLALAQFRAIEHRRWLVRSTNSGVSAFIDANGRVVKHSGSFTQEELVAQVALMTNTTVYELLGDWPGWLGLAASGVVLMRAFISWRKKSR